MQHAANLKEFSFVASQAWELTAAKRKMLVIVSHRKQSLTVVQSDTHDDQGQGAARQAVHGRPVWACGAAGALCSRLCQDLYLCVITRWPLPPLSTPHLPSSHSCSVFSVWPGKEGWVTRGSSAGVCFPVTSATCPSPLMFVDIQHSNNIFNILHVKLLNTDYMKTISSHITHISKRKSQLSWVWCCRSASAELRWDILTPRGFSSFNRRSSLLVSCCVTLKPQDVTLDSFMFLTSCRAKQRPKL